MLRTFKNIILYLDKEESLSYLISQTSETHICISRRRMLLRENLK